MALEIGSLLGSKGGGVGVDISTSSVKVLSLSSGRQGVLTLERYAIEPLAKGCVVDGNIEKIEEVADCLKRALRRAGIKAREGMTGLPASSVITKKIQLPADLPESEMEVQVESEAAQYIPFELDEVRVDFTVLGPNPNSPDDVDVLIAAARREKVDDRSAVLQAAGLTPTVMDVESFAARLALENVLSAFPDQGRDALFAVVNLGASSTSLTVLLNGEAVYEREQNFGGLQLTQDIARTYGLSSEEAEARKRSGDLPDSYARDLLQPFMETLALEVTRALQFFYTATPYNRIDHVLLAGGCAVIPGVADVVASRTQLDVSVVNPFEGMRLGSAIRERQLKVDAPSLLVACGLAMRRFDR